MKLDEYIVRMHMFHLFLYLAPYCKVMPLFNDLQYFSAIFVPNYVTFDPWVWHNKRSDNIFQFSPKGF